MNSPFSAIWTGRPSSIVNQIFQACQNKEYRRNMQSFKMARHLGIQLWINKDNNVLKTFINLISLRYNDNNAVLGEHHMRRYYSLAHTTIEEHRELN